MTHADPVPDLTIQGRATPAEVRGLLAALRSHLATRGTAEGLCGTVELTVAEALNNIAEHAYAGRAPGPVILSAHQRPDGLTVVLRDQGAPLPGLALPNPRLPDASGPRESLPEGGFGWCLIHDLTRALQYDRTDGQNRLTLEFANNPG